MAKKEKKDVSLSLRLEEFERRMFLLKIQYEKYFSGLEKIEPLKEREELRRVVRDLMREFIPNTRQRHKFTTLKARFNSMEMYWQRNIVQIERGTHPKMKFRLAVQQQQKRDAEANRIKRTQRRERFNDRQKEELAYRTAYDRYMQARESCGQSSQMSYDVIKENLKKQVRMIKSQYRCEKVKFRVAVEGGKAKMKAIPIRDGKKED